MEKRHFYFTALTWSLICCTMMVYTYLYLYDSKGMGNVVIQSINMIKRETTNRHEKLYNITWFNLPTYLALNWREEVQAGFNSCEYSNCNLLFGHKHAPNSDAVLFDGRFVKPEHFFKRRPGQVWVFAAHEPPVAYNHTGAHWTRGGWVSSFNWTMTYDKSNTDIHLPYGEIQLNPNRFVGKNYSRIFRNKKYLALIVHSHCPTPAKREIYVKSLQKFMKLDSFGKCGKPWNCGKRCQHKSGNCFDIINNYKFYLAFENSQCNQYFTEKLYRNFHYDSIMVIRGGRGEDAKRMFPNGIFVNTEDFKSIKDMAEYLKTLAASEKLYTEMLRKKDEYYSIPYKTVYQRAMCELCERMNKQDKYRKQIKSIVQWAFGKEHCEKPSDLNET